MDWLNTAVAVLALALSGAAFLRTLFLDQVVADLLFEWNATLGIAEGKIVIENPLRHSIYMRGIRFKEPGRQDIVVRMAGTSLRDVISDAYDEVISRNDSVAVINARISPKDKLEIELQIKREDTGLHIEFEWSKSMRWTVRFFFIPRTLKYSQEEINVMKRTAKRGEPEKQH